MINRTIKHSYEFDNFRIDVEERVLYLNGALLPLPPKVFDTLLALVEQNGHIVAKEELIKRVWPDTFVEENNLSQYISILRKTLGDERHDRRYIETVPRRGYRFAGKVHEVWSEDGEVNNEVRPVVKKETEEFCGSADVPASGEMASASMLATVDAATAHPSSQTKRHRGKIVLALAVLGIVAAGVAFGIYRTFSNKKVTTAAQAPFAPRMMQITTSAGLDLDPAFSPDGSHIAYSSNHRGNFEIYVKSLTPGGREVQITEDGQRNSQPTWSPDGRRIAYHSRNRGGIWVMPALGGLAKQLTELGSNPTWSPDGSLIAFQSSASPNTSSSTISIVSPEGGAPRHITRAGTQVGKHITPVGGHVSPSWSPDGKRIVFHTAGVVQEIWSITVSRDDLNLVSRPTPNSPLPRTYPVYSPDGKAIYFSLGGNALWKVLLDENGESTGEQTRIADLGGVMLRSVAISPDGNRIAYSAQSGAINLWTASISLNSKELTGPPVPLTNDFGVVNTQPAFSPDGRLIAFRRYMRGVAFGSEVWLMDVDGKNQRQLTHIPNFPVNQPNWFPAGDQITFLTNIQGHLSVWSTPVMGGKEKLLVDIGRGMEYARLSPDGKQVAFHLGENGIINLWIVPVNGGPPRQLTFDQEMMGFPTWSPDGRFLAFQVKRGDDTHVFTMPSGGGEPVQLTFDRGQCIPYSWSPDGDKIMFAAYRDGHWNVWWISRSTKIQKQLTNDTKPNTSIRSPAWSPLGDRIVYEYSETTSNIWVMEFR